MFKMRFQNRIADFICVVIFVLTYIHNGGAILIQHQAVFYQDFNCSGSQIIVNNTVDDLTITSWASNASSIRFTGLWKYREESNVDDRISIVTEVAYGTTPGGICVNRNQSTGNHKFRFVEKVGPDGESNQITLCTGKDFNGLRLKVLDSKKVVANQSVAILSWFLAGDKAWYIYSANDFKGNRTCICPGSVASTGNSSETEYGGLVFTRASDPIILGSAKIAESGCLECTYEPATALKPSSYSTYLLLSLATFIFFIAKLNNIIR